MRSLFLFFFGINRHRSTTTTTGLTKNGGDNIEASEVSRYVFIYSDILHQKYESTVHVFDECNEYLFL